MKKQFSAVSTRRAMLGLLALSVALVAVPCLAQEAAKAASGDQEAIKIQLPQPVFGGTPMNYVSPNLEPRSFKPRPPFMAPKGAVNLAKGKKVTSSAAPTIGKLEQITDGDREATEKGVVELPAGKQWVQIDLGAPATIYAVLVWHNFMSDRVYFDTVVQVSDDPEFAKGVTALYNNDTANALGLGVGKDKEFIETNEGRLIDAKGAKGRYLRLYSKGNTTDDANHYIEVEVYGKPAQ